MIDRKLSPVLVALVAFAFVATATAAGWRLLNGDGSLLRHVVIEYDHITPNADGMRDATPVQYEISRNATVTIYFENEAGERFYFRRDRLRGAGQYRVLFSGIVEGYRLPDEAIEGEILARLLQNGTYTWTITATDETGLAESVQGRITIAEADTALPELRNFSLDKQIFTPNRDGIDDRVLIQYYLPKEVKSVRVFLLTPDEKEIPISRAEMEAAANQPGRHFYDYEGGVDNNETPPPDGTYPIVAVAEDHEGQKIRVESSLTIQYGGVPRAHIVSPPTGDTLRFDVTAVPLCGVIHFNVTIENDGTTPIRTSGPNPGTVYDSNWNYNTLGWHTESGAWRVGIGFENELKDYPFRWAVGNPEDLEEIDGNYYLMPGKRTVISGGIRVVDVFGDRNPQPMWAGLIHEDVEVSEFNRRVDPHEILVDMPSPDHRQSCEEREIPVRGE